MLKGGRLIQPGSDTNSTACLTKQFFGGRVLTGMSSTKRIWGFLVRIILQGTGPLTTPASLLPLFTNVVEEAFSEVRIESGLCGRILM